MEFIFPTGEITNVSSLQEARRLITFRLEQQNLASYCSYKYQLVGSKYIYCRCRACPARVVFRRDENSFVLFRIQTVHKHQKIRPQRMIVLQAIQAYPESFTTTTIKEITMRRFGISGSTFFRYFRQAKAFGQTIQDVLTSLRSQGFLTICIKSENDPSGLPDILMVTCELMKQKYRQNQRNVKFDLTYNLVREQTPQQRQYAVGVFACINNNLNIDPICFVMLSNQTKETFVRMFIQFFSMFSSCPRIIVTDQQKTIALALEELHERQLFAGEHFIDLFHVLRNAKKSLFCRPNFNDLVLLSHSCNSLQYYKRLAICQQKFVPRDQHILNSFHQKMHRCCIGLLPPIFIGLSCSTNICEKLNDLIKTRVPYSKNYLAIANILPKFLLGLIQRQRKLKISKFKTEECIALKEVSELRQRLCKNLFQKLIRQLSLSITCLINIAQDSNKFYVKEEDFEEDESFVVVFDDSTAKWLCDCQLTEKIGIPCAHILKALLLMRQKIVTAINPWWLLEDLPPMHLITTKMPRKTRRRK